ncbi:zinc ribbon-containing protein, partial [Klebsiella pneumoniae]|uniref:zinc ribbon-containing protein n=1 Tax=Klebsiella pneumoniae TaxID=573 RepID=UPI00359C2548
MMNKVAQYYRELVSSLSERLRHGERDIDALVTQAREKIVRAGDLTQSEIESVIAAVKRDLEEFARSYEESHEDESDSVFMRVIKESLWQELADITDKTQLEWREVFQDLNHHRVYHNGGGGGLGQPGCGKGPHHPAGYTPGGAPRR